MSTILVVEDSRTQRHMMSELLRASGFEVAAAENGLDALAQISHCQPDLVILDVVMPGMSGYEVCRRIKANAATRSIPVVFCSSNATDADRYWGLKQGATAYLCKPFQPPELIATVHQVLAITATSHSSDSQSAHAHY